MRTFFRRKQVVAWRVVPLAGPEKVGIEREAKSRRTQQPTEVPAWLLFARFLEGVAESITIKLMQGADPFEPTVVR